ncbi:MAG: oligosaccharide flippase family protein [Pseudomonadota bacterium]
MLKRLARMIREDSLRAKSLRSAFWTMFGFGGESALRLISNLILTRLLAPEAFGLMALAFVFLNGVQLMSDLGTRASVIRSARRDADFLATAWTVQALRGLVISVVACAIAWPISRIYDEPQLFPVLCVISATTAIMGFQSISVSTAARDMTLARHTMVLILTQLITITVMVIVAWQTGSVWALVVGAVLGASVNSGLTHLVLPRFEHRFRLEREALRELIRFGRWVILSTMFHYLGGRGITLVHGALVSLTTLGVLAISTTLIRAFEDLVVKLLSNVALPAFSETLRKNPEAIGSVLARVRSRVILGAMGFFVALAFLAQPLIDFLYPPDYAMAGGFLALQALNGAARVFCMPYQTVILATGDSRAHAAVMFVSAALGILGTIAGFHLFGAFGMILGMGAAAFVVFALSAYIAWRRGFADIAFDVLVATLLVTTYAVTLDRLIVFE